MIRRALFDLFLFLLPFVVYVLYLRFAPKREEAKKEAPARAHPWTLLCISGLVLVVLSFVWLGLEEGQAQGFAP